MRAQPSAQQDAVLRPFSHQAGLDRKRPRLWRRDSVRRLRLQPPQRQPRPVDRGAAHARRYGDGAPSSRRLPHRRLVHLLQRTIRTVRDPWIHREGERHSSQLHDHERTLRKLVADDAAVARGCEEDGWLHLEWFQLHAGYRQWVPTPSNISLDPLTFPIDRLF